MEGFLKKARKLVAGMHDLTYDSISKPFKDRVKSQMKGYVSKDAEDKHKNDEFGNNFGQIEQPD